MIPEFTLHEIWLGPVHLHVFGTLVMLGVITGHMVFVRRALAEPLGAPWVVDLGLLEALFTLALLVVAEATWRALGAPSGAITAAVAMSYALLRFSLEFMRGDAPDGSSLSAAGLTAAQWGCLPLFAVGLAALAFAVVAPQGKPVSSQQR